MFVVLLGGRGGNILTLLPVKAIAVLLILRGKEMIASVAIIGIVLFAAAVLLLVVVLDALLLI